MRTRMRGSSSLCVGVALLVAMTSTASAQSGEWKDGSLSLGPAPAPQATLGESGTGLPTLSARSAADAAPTVTGTCGTDIVVPKPLELMRLHMAAMLFAVAIPIDPVHPLKRVMAFWLWLQSAIDVLPPL